MLKKSLTIATLLALFMQGCSNNHKKEDVESVNSMLSTNEYVLTTLDKSQKIVKKEGNGFVLDGAKGKVVMFDIFATWCPPCQHEAKHLSSLQKKFKNNLVIIGLTVEDMVSNSKLKEFADKYHAKYTFVNSDQNRRLINAIATELKLGNNFPIPLMVMYKDGKLITHYVGATQEEFIESDIKRALGK